MLAERELTGERVLTQFTAAISFYIGAGLSEKVDSLPESFISGQR